MSNPTEKAPPADNIPEVIPPNCPQCKKPMPMVGLYAYQIERMIIPAILCPFCHILLHIEIIRPPQPASDAPATEPPKSPLWKPS